MRPTTILRVRLNRLARRRAAYLSRRLGYASLGMLA
jgi:hypothetical protein